MEFLMGDLRRHRQSMRPNRQPRPCGRVTSSRNPRQTLQRPQNASLGALARDTGDPNSHSRHEGEPTRTLRPIHGPPTITAFNQTLAQAAWTKVERNMLLLDLYITPIISTSTNIRHWRPGRRTCHQKRAPFLHHQPVRYILQKCKNLGHLTAWRMMCSSRKRLWLPMHRRRSTEGGLQRDPSLRLK